MGALSILSGIGMALGPPCIYLGQVYSIYTRKDSTGFSPDVCAVLLVANVCRCVFWLGKRFETPLLFQSLALILSMLGLQFLLLEYKRPSSPSDPPRQRRPFNFWQWESYGSYVEFLAALIVGLCLAYVCLGSFGWFVDALGFVALGIESQLPTPQVISNFRRRSTAGLQLTTIAGWLGGDIYKTIYFYLRASPSQFIICSLVTVTLDLVIVGQRLFYGADEKPASPSPSGGAMEAAEEEEAEGLEAGRASPREGGASGEGERGGLMRDVDGR